MKKILNKKASLPILLLVIGILAVLFLTLFTFYSSTLNSTEVTFQGIEKMQALHINLEKYLSGDQSVRIETLFDARGKKIKKIQEEVRVRHHWYSRRKEKVIFYVRHYLK